MDPSSGCKAGLIGNWPKELEEIGDHSRRHLLLVVLESFSAFPLYLRMSLRAWPISSATPHLVGSVVTPPQSEGGLGSIVGCWYLQLE